MYVNFSSKIPKGGLYFLLPNYLVFCMRLMDFKNLKTSLIIIVRCLLNLSRKRIDLCCLEAKENRQKPLQISLGSNLILLKQKRVT